MATKTTNDEDKKRYVVEGAWLEGNDGSPVTTDWVVATSEEEAEAMVAKVRGRLEEWRKDFVMTFGDYIHQQRQQLADMSKLSQDEVEAAWEETKKNLGWDDEDDEEEN